MNKLLMVDTFICPCFADLYLMWQKQVLKFLLIINIKVEPKLKQLVRDRIGYGKDLTI